MSDSASEYEIVNNEDAQRFELVVDEHLARIDYVMVRNGVMPLRYEVFLRLRRNGTFHPAYRGSDHNMVLGTWRLPVVVW